MAAASSCDALIPQCFAGRSVFITGATGFLGKVLVNRLLATCPDIGRLYLLIRAKKKATPEQRLQDLLQSQIFDDIRLNDPSQLGKLQVIPGDIRLPQLGISTESLTLLNDVSVVFHSAATVKFNEELKTAVEQNVSSIMRLLELCDRLPNLDAYIQVSTAYSNAEKDIVGELVYSPPVPVEQLLALVDTVPAAVLKDITAKYISPKPNTYTFTKAIAENVLEQHTNRQYSVAIFRPTIVISAVQNPYPGWVEGLNGAAAVLIAAGKGLLHVMGGKLANKTDMLPVDIAIDTLIAVGWETLLDRTQEVKVYNCSSADNPTRLKDFENGIRKNLRLYPLDGALWYPSGVTVENKYAKMILEFLLQTIPAHMAEYICRLFRIKTKFSLIQANQKVIEMTEVLKFFCTKEFQFDTSNVRRLHLRLSEADSKIYKLDIKDINWDQHYRDFVKGARKYLLREKDENMSQAKRHMRKMKIIHQTVLLATAFVMISLILQNDIIRQILYGLVKLLLSLLYTAYARITA